MDELKKGYLIREDSEAFHDWLRIRRIGFHHEKGEGTRVTVLLPSRAPGPMGTGPHSRRLHHP